MRSSEACGYVRSGPKDGVAIRAARPVKVAGFPWDDEEDLSDAENDALGGNVPLATPARIQIVVVSEIPVTASVVFVGKQNRPAAWRDFHDDDKPKLVWDETRVWPEGFCECGWTRRGKGCCAEIASENQNAYQTCGSTTNRIPAWTIPSPHGVRQSPQRENKSMAAAILERAHEVHSPTVERLAEGLAH
jgi:hypothetical protein